MWQIENNFKTEEEFGIWDDSWTSAYFHAIRHKKLHHISVQKSATKIWTIMNSFARFFGVTYILRALHENLCFKIVLRPLPDLPLLTGFCLSWIMYWIDFCILLGIYRGGRSQIIFSNPRCQKKYSAKWYSNQKLNSPFWTIKSM